MPSERPTPDLSDKSVAYLDALARLNRLARTQKWALLVTHVIDGKNREIVRLRAAEQAARREALEEAAELCDDVAEQETIRTAGRPTSGEYQIGARNCAEAGEEG